MKHLDQATLSAFGRGLLGRDEMNEVETHLAICDSCCDALSSVPDDEFVASIRIAQTILDATADIWGKAPPSMTRSERVELSNSADRTTSLSRDSASSSERVTAFSVTDENDFETTERRLEQTLPAELANHPRVPDPEAVGNRRHGHGLSRRASVDGPLGRLESNSSGLAWE